MHGIKTRKQSLGSHPNLQSWYTHEHKQRVDSQVRGIFTGHRKAKMGEAPESYILPPSWGHKSEALIGDTVYLSHNNSIRSFILSALDKTEVGDGHASITSPIGQALLGRHQGDTVHLATLDGDLDYKILKIV